MRKVAEAFALTTSTVAVRRLADHAVINWLPSMLRDSIWILTPNRSAPYESAALPTSVNHNHSKPL
jgi:hypothetical protein